MPYSDFTLGRLKQTFRLDHRTTHLFGEADLPVIAPSERLQQDLDEALQMPVFTEKAKSELLITPILLEVRRRNPGFTLFSGFTFNVAPERDLTGAPDYLFTARANIVEIEAPVFCIVEAKNRTLEEAFGQCGAEMYAARLFNERDYPEIESIFGAVTNGFDWAFLKLERDTILIDTRRAYLNDLPLLLGIFQFIVDQYEPVFS